MIFADKLILLRKKNGWSQEELAEQLNVTRQSVSKWEGAQSVPDLEKMVRLSKLFGVSTDYLLKDEIEETEYISLAEDKDSSFIRNVSMEEASAFLQAKEATAKPIAYGVFLCILSPVCLLLLGAISETKRYGLPENIAGAIGMIVLLVLVAVAVAVFILSGNKTAPFEYLEKEVFETEYGVNGMVKARREQYKSTYTKSNILGVCLCILSLIPLFLGVIINEDDELILIIMLSFTFLLVAIGVVFIVSSGIIWASFEKLLQEGDYSRKKKEGKAKTFSGTYWLIVTAIFLGYSLSTNNWGYSWIIWVVAGVLYPAILAIVNSFDNRNDKNTEL